MSRTDDVINVAGHRISSGALEEVLISHPNVAECCVIGPADELKGQLPVGFVVMTSGAEATAAEVEADVVRMVREQVGPVAAFKSAYVVPTLPKTRSGKILRGILLKIADGEEFVVPGTIEDAGAVDVLQRVIAERWATGTGGD